MLLGDYAADYKLYITDSGCYDYGFVDRLPSGQAYWFGVTCWYRYEHPAKFIIEPIHKGE